MLVYIWFRATFPRFRFDQLMDLGWKWMIPLALGNIVVTGIFVLAGQERLMYWIGFAHDRRDLLSTSPANRRRRVRSRARTRWSMQVEYPKPRWTDQASCCSICSRG